MPDKAVYMLELRRHGDYRVETDGLTAAPVQCMGGLRRAAVENRERRRSRRRRIRARALRRAVRAEPRGSDRLDDDLPQRTSAGDRRLSTADIQVAKKLGITDGMRLTVLNALGGYRSWLKGLPPTARLAPGSVAAGRGRTAVRHRTAYARAALTQIAQQNSA